VGAVSKAGTLGVLGFNVGLTELVFIIDRLMRGISE
jgi:hypothetical protein